MLNNIKNFLIGVGSIFNFFGGYYNFYNYITDEEEAIKSNWNEDYNNLKK